MAKVFTILVTFAATLVNVHGQYANVNACFVNKTEELKFDLMHEGFKRTGPYDLENNQ